MPHRDVSPAASEQDYDIAQALAPDAEFNVSRNDPQNPGKLRRGRVSTDAKKSINLDVVSGDEEEGDTEGSDDEAFIAAQQAASNRKSSNIKGKTAKKGGGFQSMGLNPALLRAITRKGFSVPTPIQRKTIPPILDNYDVVGMARTGSGKTAAFVIPLIEKLKAHSVKIGARAILLSPSRELSLQTLRAVKEFGKGTDLRTVLIVGGESLEDQFSQMATNPDIIIASPGRFLHLIVEMSLELSAVQYVVFDEADRLFEMGFALQLNEILHALPVARQTLLFSATLPTSLLEFANAGLSEPTFVRLDAESKISPDLQSVFLTCKSAEKDGALLHVLQDLIKIPTATPEETAPGREVALKNNRKRKRDSAKPNSSEVPTAHSSIVFAATKHHVEYLTGLLRLSGFPVSYAYGSLDQTALRQQIEKFRAGETTVLVVTDLAARGIDIPMLANVINYDFPSQPKVFVHRVGRTARAGRKGWSYSLVPHSDVPYLLDLQLFLARELITVDSKRPSINFAEDIVVGSIPRSSLEKTIEWSTKLLDENEDLAGLRTVASRGEKRYLETRRSASTQSARRAKKLNGLRLLQESNPLYQGELTAGEHERDQMLAKISGFRPSETVFELGTHGNVTKSIAAKAAEVMRGKKEKARLRNANRAQSEQDPAMNLREPVGREGSSPALGDLSEDEENTDYGYEGDENMPSGASPSNSLRMQSGSWRDSENFMSYEPTHANLAEERGYGVHSGSNQHDGASDFAAAARDATMDLANDEVKAFAEPSRPRQMQWDRRKKNYVAKDGEKGGKMITGESGRKIAATFRSGRFDAWKKSNRMDRLPKIGETEPSGRPGASDPTRRFKHHAQRTAKQPDRFRDDYHKKKKRLAAAKGDAGGNSRQVRARPELRDVDDVQRQRKAKQKRKEKNARPARRPKGN